MKIIEKKQKRAQIAKEAREMLDQAELRGGLNQEEETQWNRMMEDVDKLGAEIEREERMLSLESGLEERDGSPAKYVDGTEEKREMIPVTERKEYREAFNRFLISGMGELNQEERSILNQGRANLEQRALSAVTGAAGGFTVPTGFFNELIESMKAYGGMRQARSRVLTTKSGNPLPIPKGDDTGNTGAIVGENTAAGNATDPVFSQANLGAYKYTSKVFLIPIELLQDSAFNIEEWIREVIVTRIGRITNTHFTVGTGSGQPNGVVTGAGLGKTGATGQTAAVTYDDLVDLIHSVDPAYRVAPSEFMFNDNTLKVIRKLKDSQGIPLWQPSLQIGVPDTILGYRYVINQDVASMAANAKSILFGDFRKFFIRDVMDVSIFRMGEKYIDSGQVGFVAFSRHDSVMSDNNAIKYYQNSAT